MTDNPLLSLPFDIPFDRIEAAHVEPAIDALIEEAQAAIDAISTLEGPRTYANTLGALEDATERLAVAITVVGHLESVATTEAFRAAYNAVQPKASAFWSSVTLDPKLYAALCAFAETEEAKALEAPFDRLLEKTLDSFRRNGAELGEGAKARLHEIDVALGQKTTTFTQNVLDATNDFELLVEDEAKLAGLPESARAAARQSAESKGRAGARFTLQAPSFTAVLTHMDDASLREQMWRAMNTRASGGQPDNGADDNGARDNGALILEILQLRREKAKLLGYADFADYVLERRMAKDGAKAYDFVTDLHARTRPAFDRETEALRAFRQRLEGTRALEPWDVAYYAEKLRKEEHDFDDEALRPYFPVESCLRGLFELTERLYGVQVRPREAPGWDQAVRNYGIYEGERLLAAFYVDLYPRENKRGGAWMNALINGGDPETPGPHLGLFCANLSPPVGDAPTLLRHREVETLFHEFGHLLHHALSEVPVKSLGGTNVAWDFVELPSQIMENFCWERASLDLFARHHETGDPIPEALLEKMRGARTYRGASAQMRQLGFASLDLRLHRELDPQATDRESLLAFAREILEAHRPAELPAEYAMVCAFTHLFSSPTAYAAGYYSYKWAEVLDADAFTRFAKAGVISPEVGKAFRDAILSQGDSDEPENLYRRFMGREPRLDALLQRIGLAA